MLYEVITKVLIGFMPFTVIFGLLNGLDSTICLLLPVFVVCVKTIISASIFRITSYNVCYTKLLRKY